MRQHAAAPHGSDDLQDFLAGLAADGEVRRIRTQVDPDGEIAEITARVAAGPEPPVLLFENVAGSPFPVVTNTFGSLRRVARAICAAAATELVPLMDKILATAGDAATEAEAWLRIAGTFPELLPREVAHPAWGEVAEEPALLERLPFIRNFRGDGGSYLTLPLVFTRHPDSGEQNCGIYRLQRLGGDRIALGWHPGSGGSRQGELWRQRGIRMPVAVALGGDPAVIFAAGFGYPAGADELHLAGILRGRPVDAARSPGTGMLLPAGAELVIEGYVEPDETAVEGPFGNHTGFYSPARRVPVLRVTGIRRKRCLVIPATVVGEPPTENTVLAQGWERLLLPWLRRRCPEIVAISFPRETIFHRGAVVAVAAGTDTRELLARLRAEGPLTDSRFLVIVDDDVDPADTSAVFRRALNGDHFPSGMTVSGPRIDIDATRRGREPAAREPEVVARIASRWQEFQ